MDNTIYKSTITPKVVRKENMDIPFDKLKPGQSVFRNYGEVNELSLRSKVSTNSKKYEYDFMVIKHKDRGIFEIGCVFKNSVANEIDYSNQIVESSPEMKAQISTGLNGKRKYPFYELPEGYSFIVPIIETVDPKTNEVITNEKSVRVACCIQSKRLDTKFICIKHEQYKMLEVGHLPKVTPTFYESSTEMSTFFIGGANDN